MDLLPWWVKLSGAKTYIVGVATIIVGWHQGNTEMIMMGLGMITIRMGIAKQ